MVEPRSEELEKAIKETSLNPPPKYLGGLTMIDPPISELCTSIERIINTLVTAGYSISINLYPPDKD